MSYLIKYDKEDDCIVIVFEGAVTAESIKEAAPRVARMCKETGCRRILNDMSAATINISFLEIFGSPEIMDNSKVPRSAKRALIVPPDFNNAYFLETVSRNRGHDMMVFNDRGKAKKWLFGQI